MSRVGLIGVLLLASGVLLVGAFRFPAGARRPANEADVPRDSGCVNVTAAPAASWWSFPLRFNPQIEYETEYWYNLWNVWTHADPVKGDGDSEADARPPHRRRHFGIQLALYRFDTTWQCNALGDSEWLYQIGVSDTEANTYFSYEIPVTANDMSHVSTGSDKWLMVGPNARWEQTDSDFKRFHIEYTTALAGASLYGVNVSVELLEPGTVPVQHNGYMGVNGTGMIVMEQIFLRIHSGEITAGGVTYRVDDGTGMLGRALSTRQAGTTWDGWDWNFLQTDEKVYIAQIRPRDNFGHYMPGAQGLNYVSPPAAGSNEWSNVYVADFTNDRSREWTSPATNVTYLLDSQLVIPAYDFSVKLVPFIDDNELSHDGKPQFYEGANHFAGTVGSKHARGYGYTEMTGCCRP